MPAATITNCSISATAASWSDSAASCSNRPCPAAEGVAKSRPELWAKRRRDFAVHARRRWLVDAEASEAVACLPNGTFVHERRRRRFACSLKRCRPDTSACFPSSARIGTGLRGRSRKAASELIGRPLRVLNLFAYTGGSTLAAAAAGAEVVHIDAARNIVDRARQNAELSGLADRPIRWIAEDAMKFCQRELKRGNRYDAVILDPPSTATGRRASRGRSTSTCCRCCSCAAS